MDWVFARRDVGVLQKLDPDNLGDEAALGINTSCSVC